jgi:hypothetical protein
MRNVFAVIFMAGAPQKYRMTGFIHQTDLFHPHGDPDDHGDLHLRVAQVIDRHRQPGQDGCRRHATRARLSRREEQPAPKA